MADCLWLSRDDLAACLSMPAAIEAVAGAFIAHSAGTVIAPVRTALELPGGAVTLTMPAALPEAGATAVKVVSVYPHNPRRGLPSVLGLVVALDAGTGEPVAVMDGSYLTGMRTGAASGVATRALARPEASVLGMLGTGFQARFQVEAVVAVRPVKVVRVYGRDAARRERFAFELEGRLASGGCEVEITPVDTPADAVCGADIICAATTSSTPVFEAGDVAAGAHINGVGSFRLDMREAPVELFERARVVVDSREAAEAEAGDLLPAVQAGTLSWGSLPELGEVLLGQEPGRQSPVEITFFKSVGLAAQDVATGGLAVRRARELGIGASLHL